MESGAGKMGEWLIKKGIVRDDAGAQKLLITLIIICFVGIVYMNLK